MSAKIQKLPRKLHSRQFCSKYPRLERTNIALCPEYVSEEREDSLSPLQNLPTAIYAATKESPLEDLCHVFDVNLITIVPRLNTLLLYRMLKLMYGDADTLGSWITSSNGGKRVTVHRGPEADWGYTLRINDNLVAEVRSMLGNALSTLRFWCPETLDQSLHEDAIRSAMSDCAAALRDALEKNRHLFDEKVDLKREHVTKLVATENIFANNYHSAEQLLALAKEVEQLPARQKLLYLSKLSKDQEMDLYTFGFLYSSASFAFIIALESLINTLFTVLLKEEFRHESYERVTIRADLDLRLLTMHLFCKGFRAPVVSRDTDLSDRFEKLKKFRNETFHGNVVKEHDVYMILKDGIFFVYTPSTQFRGIKAERKAEKGLPLSMSIGPETVTTVKKIVDEVIEAVILAMDDETRKWVAGWLHQPQIPRL